MEIAQIKRELPIETVLAHFNIVVNKNKHCLCPFHEDKTPSMRIYPETNTYHCFGCGKTGDNIQLIQDHVGCNKHEAIVKAKDLLGRAISENPPIVKNAVAIDYQGVFKILEQKLHSNNRAITYLKDRMIYDAKLEYGYKPHGESKLYSGMSSCTVFPLKNPKGEIVSLYGRSITSKGKHFYSKNRQGLYPHYPNPEARQLIITEAIIDAATLLKYTDYEVLAMYGTNGLTAEHLEAICQLQYLEEIIFFLDGDAAGQDAAIKYSKTLNELLPSIAISTVATPENEDVNSLVISHEAEILEHLIKHRTTIFSSTETTRPAVEQEKKPAVAQRLNAENPDYLTLTYEPIKITVLGGINLQTVDKLKVTLKIELTDKNNPLRGLRQSNLDLYQDEYLEKFIRKISERLELGTREVQHALYLLINELESYREQQNEAKKVPEIQPKKLSIARKQELLKFLKAPNLLKRTNALIGKTGMIGENNNRLLMYLVFTSRLREQPLHIISLGASGTGKTYLQEKIAALIPEQEKLEITALSENALYYFDRTELKNKLVLIEDLDGAQDDKILYAIRELMSKKRISKTIPIKDSKGNLKTVTLQVEGPISLAGTTTREKLYEDNANRSLLIYLDNSKQQKEAIMAYQQALSAGLIDKKEEERAIEWLQDVQLMLEKVKVRNPYATKLNIPNTVFKPLRTNTHYLNFIEVITFYNQHQRSVKTDAKTGERYIEASLEDIEQANILLKDVLLAKSDELTKGCRDFLERLKRHLVTENKASFYSSEIRKAFRMSPNNLKYYLAILGKYHLVKSIGGNPRSTGYEYEIVSLEEYKVLKNKLKDALDTAFASLNHSVVGN